MEIDENPADLLKLALSGNEDAWDKLFVILWPVIYGTVWSKIKDSTRHGTIEDIIQDIFARLLADNAKRFRQYSPEKGILTHYIATIARNHVIDLLRSPANRQQPFNISEITEPAANDQNSDLSVEEVEMVSALGTLTRRERQVIELLYNENLDTSEAAVRMNVTAATIRSSKAHALEKLRHFFKTD